MPRLSAFYGIVIAMHYDDHEPAHFHAVHGEFRAQVGIRPFRFISGELPNRVHDLVYDWWALHRDELEENWLRARTHRALQPIAPLR